MGELPRTVVERILKQESGIRVSSEAVLTASTLAEAIIRYLGREGSLLAKHAGRNTLMSTDLKLASRRIGEVTEEVMRAVTDEP